MKYQRLFHSALAALILGLSAWLLMWMNHPAKVTAQKTPATAKATNSVPALRAAAEINGIQYASELTVAQKTRLSEDPSAAHRYVVFAQMRFETNSKRIDFYGKVVDQHGQPIAGVHVKGSILLVVSPISSANKEVVTETDSEGKFQFVGLHGADFGLILQKAGYESNGRSKWSAAYKPDPNNPVVYTLWKLKGAEPIVHTQLDSRIPYDGVTAAFDLLSGKKTAAGDLRVTLERSPLRVKRGVDHFDWNVRIEMAGGGFVETTEAYQYLAPDAGYQPALVFAQAKNDPEWTQRLTKTFYLRTAEGQYGRVVVDLTMDSARADTGISIETWINASRF